MKKVRQWDQELNVGVRIIDNQHKIIFDLINDLSNVSEAMADRKVIDTLLDIIENYVFRHFEAEEELFRHHQDSMMHCLEHYGMVKDFRKFRLSSRNKNATENNISVFLEQWFLAHIKEHDIPFFVNIASGMDSKEEEKMIDEYPFGTKERRRHKRIQRRKITDRDIIASCYNTTNLKNNQATVIDLSLGGMRIKSSEAYKIGDLLIVSCSIGRNFKMKEKVRIVNAVDNYYGAEFINLSPVAEKFLIELYGAVNIRNF